MVMKQPQLQDLTWDWLEETLSAHEQEALAYRTDPFALSMAAHRMAAVSNFAVNYPSLDLIEPALEDQTRAQDMRRYYRDRFMLKVLRGQPLTKFQRTVQDLLEDRVPLQNQHLGIVYQLPYFYHEDLAHDALCQEFGKPESMPHTAEKTVQRLRAKRTVIRMRKQSKSREFWWQDSLGRPVLWLVNLDNPLMSMVKGLWERDSVDVEAQFRPTAFRWQPDWQFLLAEQVTLAWP